jgi:hypothetical protein
MYSKRLRYLYSFYQLTFSEHSVNNHAEDLRHLFVGHEGQKKLRVHMHGANDFGDIALRLTEKIEENVRLFKYPTKPESVF